MLEEIVRELKERGYSKSIKDFDERKVAKEFMRSAFYNAEDDFNMIIGNCIHWYLDTL